MIKRQTFRKGNVALLTESHGAIREPQILLGQEEELSVQTELHRHWVAHLRGAWQEDVLREKKNQWWQTRKKAATAYLLKPDVKIEDDRLTRAAHRRHRVLHVLCRDAGDQFDRVGPGVIPHLHESEVEDLYRERRNGLDGCTARHGVHLLQSQRWRSTAGPAGCRWAHSSPGSGWRSGRGGPRSSPWTTWRWLQEQECRVSHSNTFISGIIDQVLPALFTLPAEWDSTNRPLKRALVRKFTTKRPWSLIRMLVG